MSELIEVTVPLGGGRDYPVLVGDGALESLPDLVPDHARRVAVVTQSGIGIASTGMVVCSSSPWRRVPWRRSFSIW